MTDTKHQTHQTTVCESCGAKYAPRIADHSCPVCHEPMEADVKELEGVIDLISKNLDYADVDIDPETGKMRVSVCE